MSRNVVKNLHNHQYAINIHRKTFQRESVCVSSEVNELPNIRASCVTERASFFQLKVIETTKTKRLRIKDDELPDTF